MWHRRGAPIKWTNIYKTSMQRKSGGAAESCWQPVCSRGSEEAPRGEKSTYDLLHALDCNLESEEERKRTSRGARSEEEEEEEEKKQRDEREEGWMELCKLESSEAHGRLRGKGGGDVRLDSTPATLRKRPKPNSGKVLVLMAKRKEEAEVRLVKASSTLTLATHTSFDDVLPQVNEEWMRPSGGESWEAVGCWNLGKTDLI